MKNENDFFLYLSNQQTAQAFLEQCYQKIEEPNANTLSFENAAAFLYYLNHGIRFFENAKEVELFIKPVLYFYGMTHLLKACLLTKRPKYPESTTLLSHGVTARKRKKKNYTFMQDEVKVQQNGLFPYFSEHLYKQKTLPFEKIKMEDLLSIIPELNSFFQLKDDSRMVSIGKLNSKLLTFPKYLLDTHHVTENAFMKKIKAHLPNIADMDIDSNSIHIQIEENLTSSFGPFFIDYGRGGIFFPVYREHFLPISEVMVHYMVLYNLSMICRYETEWWGDLLVSKPDIDYPMIVKFLEITEEKTPLLLKKQLALEF